MSKSYSDYMDEITPDDLYAELMEYGLFSEKLPPIFDGKSFLNYCNTRRHGFQRKSSHRYAIFESDRNINIPRILGIPTPMSHEILCNTLKEQWARLQRYFYKKTSGNQHKISRIHIRKSSSSKGLFDMTYDVNNDTGEPELSLSLGKRYLVKADISYCFHSIYTHAIPWALDTKQKAKKNMGQKGAWYNKIDKAQRLSTYGETHGILIGPHTSNVISEIILCAVDNELLSKKWSFIRYIDDYKCFVDNVEEANNFIIDLRRELGVYDLRLNQKKTSIEKIPGALVDSWPSQIKLMSLVLDNKNHEGKPLTYKYIKSFIDNCLVLMEHNDDNASIIFYALKVLKNMNIAESAKQYIIKTAITLSAIYPYLIPMLDECVFIPYKPNHKEIEEYLRMLYKKYTDEDKASALSYVLQLSIKYNITLDSFHLNQIQKSEDCILLLCEYIYSKRNKLSTEIKCLKDKAEKIVAQGDIDEYWPFVYECLSKNNLTGEWKSLKKGHVSFLKNEYK